MLAHLQPVEALHPGLVTVDMAVGIRHADHVVPSTRKSWH
jgi:hypothetical protein